MLSPNITNRELPLPFAWQKESQPGHFASWVVGSIEKLWLDEADNLYKYEGFFVDIPEAYEYITLIVEARTRGVSVDIDSAVVELMDGDGNAIDIWAEDFDPDTEIISYMSQGRFCGITGVPIPAFQEAFIDLGTWDEALAADAECEDCDEALVASAQDTSIDLVGDEYCMAGCGDKATMIVEVASNVSACFCAEHGAAAVSGDVLATVPDDAREFLEGFVEGGGPAITAAAFAPGTKDGPGWVTNPQATARIRRYWVRGKGAAKIRWGAPGDFNRCRRQLAKYVQNPEWLAGLCANMHKEALGIWPGQHGPDGAALAASAGPAWTIVTPRAALTAGGYMPSKSWFDNPNFTVKTPVTITEDGRIFGHVASWDQCHIGYEQCVSAPRSNSGYSYFHTGVVDTDEGPVAVGQITMNANHPDLYMSASEAKSHYDNTALAVADVRAGEDNIGIWVAGVLRPGVTDEQRYALKAAGALSGDWRPVGAGFEMVAALAVNTPGFPIPRVAIAASGALVAAAIVRQGPIVTDPVEDAARRAAAYAVEEFEGRRARRERLHALSQRSRTERQGALVASLGTEE